MAPFRALIRGIRGLLHPADRQRDARDEVEHYLAQAVAAHRARGASPEAARRAAQLELGSVAGVTDAVQGHGWENLVEAAVTDLRLAARRLRAEPGFALLVVLTLGLGIGASTAIVSAVRPVLFEPLPYPEPARILTVWDHSPDGAPLELTYNTHLELRARTTAFEALAVHRGWQPTLTQRGEPERLEGQRVSWEYFRVLGVPPARGLDFTAVVDQPGGPGPVILSDGLWRRRFGGDPGIIGRSITLSGSDHVVAGIMPAGFENLTAPAADIWAPLQYAATEGRAWGHHLRMIGRTRPGVTASAATRELASIAGTPVAEFPRVPWASLAGGLAATPLQAEITGAVRPALLAILGAVALVLVIACVNVANLLMARGARRQGEFALRATLGAGAGRLIRQAVTESLLLAILGGAAGVVLALVGVKALVALSPPGLPRVHAIAVDGTALLFAVGVSVLVGVVIGLAPARAAMAGGQAGGSLPGTRHATTRRHAASRALIVIQVALAMVLLVCSGLLLRSMQRLLRVEPGFNPAGVLTMQVHATAPRYNEDAAADRYFEEVLEAVRRLPGVVSGALTSQLPVSGDLELYGAQLEPPRGADPGEVRGSFRYAVSPGYFETMEIPLRSGRFLAAGDRAGAAPVVVISESFARRRMAGMDPLGQQLRIGTSEPYTIVGVVGNVRQESLALDDTDAVYVTPGQWASADQVMSLVVRTPQEAPALAGRIRDAVWSVDRDQPVVRVATLDGLLAATAAGRRFALLVFQAFALAALALTAAGLYGVLAGSVAERTREIGVRAALGASPLALLAMVVRQGMTLAGFGVALGLVGAFASTRALATLLFGISPLDLPTWLAVIALLVAVAVLACAAPAWRAARVPPATPLRAE